MSSISAVGSYPCPYCPAEIRISFLKDRRVWAFEHGGEPWLALTPEFIGDVPSTAVSVVDQDLRKLHGLAAVTGPADAP